MKKIKILIAIILLESSLAIFGVVIVKDITIKQNCTGYLKRATDANTVEMAIMQLNKAISYLEENNLTSGYTSVLGQRPQVGRHKGAVRKSAKGRTLIFQCKFKV